MGPGTALPGLVTVTKVTFPLCFFSSPEKWKCLPRARWCVHSAGQVRCGQAERRRLQAWARLQAGV